MNRMTLVAAAVVLSLAAAVFFVFPFPWTHSAEPKKEPTPEPKRDRFAEDRVPAETKEVRFNPNRAMEYLTEVCKLGPRISASEGMLKQQKLLQDHFEKLGAKVAWQRFEGRQPSQKAAVPMANMIVTWNPEATRRIILCGHYDTRPIADQEPKRADWFKPFVSANDGTSTVAFLMEMGHHMKEIPTRLGVDFIFFDGEEFIHDRERDKFFLGSDYFAAQYKKEKPPHKYVAAVLLDLFAGKGATYPVEQNSHFLAAELCEAIWAEAKRLNVTAFEWERGPDVLDDHIALNRAGIPAVDIIDFTYKHWHKLSDVPDNCSADSMGNVAKVLIAWMQRVQ